MNIAELFISIFNMSITASYVVVAVVLLRLLLHKAPRWISCALWALVGLRLVLPFSFESVMSVMPGESTVTKKLWNAARPVINSGSPAAADTFDPATLKNIPIPDSAAGDTVMQTLLYIAGLVWIIGMLAMVLYSVITYVRLRRSVRSAVLFERGIYQSEAVASPFITGVLRPKIYLPFSVGEADRSYVISHEKTHIKRKDHWIKPFGFLLLTVYWFNPLIWVAYILLCRDIEFACDEAVMRKIGDEKKRAYSTALLDCAANRRSIAICPLAFGEVGVKDRVKNVLNYKRPAFWVIVLAVVVCIVSAVCLLSNPKGNDDTSFEHPYAEQLFAYRTSFVGDNSAVAGIIGLLEFPTDIMYDHIELHTGAQPYGVEVYFNTTPEVKAVYYTSDPDHIETFQISACIMFSLIENADQITFYLDDGSENNDGFVFTREWAESVVGADLWTESSSAENLDSLITQIGGHVENAYAPADEGIPEGTFAPSDVVYLGFWNDVTADGFLAQHKDETFTMASGTFHAGQTGYRVRYEDMTIGDEIATLDENDAFAVDVSGFGNKAGWRVVTTEGSDTGYRIFLMDAEVWVGHWGWYGSDHDAWWCEYLFRVSPTDGGATGIDSVGEGQNSASIDFHAGQYRCIAALPGSWKDLYSAVQSDRGITFYDEANADYGGCLFAIFWMTENEAEDPWAHGIAIDGCKLIQQTDGGGFYAVYPYTDVEYDYEDEKKTVEYQSMLADMDDICDTLVYSAAQETAGNPLPATDNLPRGYEADAADDGTLYSWQDSSLNTRGYIGWIKQPVGWLVLKQGISLGSEDAYVYLTYDGGRTWVEIGNANSLHRMGVTGAGFASEQVGFISYRYYVDAGPDIWQTTDGGDTWARMDITVPERYRVESYRFTPLSPQFDGEEGDYPILVYKWRDDGNYDQETITMHSHDGGLSWSF